MALAAKMAMEALRRIAAAFMTRYGILWPVLTAFLLFVLAMPILLQPRTESNPSEQ